MKRAHIAASIALISALLMPTVARAELSSEHIQNFQSHIHITKQNRVEITETIDYDLGTSQHHGIFRDIPVDYRDSEGKTYHLAFLEGTVTDERGQSLMTERSKSGNNIELKIGDPNTLISGLHTFKLSYALTPVVNLKDGKDHLALDITGNGWQVPIEHVSATVTVDSSVFMNTSCYAGPAGSGGSTGCDVIPHPSADQQQLPPLTVSSTPGTVLMPGDGLTLETYLPKGYVDHYLVAGASAPLTGYDYGWIAVVLACLGLAGLVALILALRWIRERRRKAHQTIVPEYESPDGLLPAEVGTLLDDKSDMKEITATLIDLSVRGYIKIEQTAPKSLFSKARYRLTKLKDYSDTQNYEQTLLGGVFGGAGDVVELSTINKSQMSVAVQAVKSRLKERLTTAGYYGSFASEQGIVNKALGAGSISDSGAAEWAKVKGFKWYLSVAEKDRLNFTDAPERTPERFSKLLPFAVALGVEKEWAKQFEGIDVSQGVGWYGGYNAGAWTALALSDDLQGGFASAVSSNFVAPSGGGGGVSGGGFGGGGGGSW